MNHNLEPAQRSRKERVRAFAEKHWLGIGLADTQRAAIDEIRRQYALTAREYFNAASTLYDTLGIQPEKLTARQAPFALGNRNVQLFLAYSILWEAFNHIYTAAAYTDFARNGLERAPLEDERVKIARVLGPPLIENNHLRQITALKNGETANAAINRMIGRSSRELKEIYGVTSEYSLTDMDAFLQGVVEVTETQNGASVGHSAVESESWVIQPLDDVGKLIDADSPFSASKYRSVIKWDCYQIRQNLNFLGKSEGSIDDAILIIRAFCLVAPIVTLLLHESRKAAVFAL